ncbi:hypothetical protein F5Y10DRAFT_241015 [Nemania abortiva]|nr:hypothetical protein F5Y10DRAFT_241015 [Nemania abortiva]
MPHPVIRSACDRCHDQKLRCTRAASGGPCVRCNKSKATCTWTPLSTRRQREPKRGLDNTASALPDAVVTDTSMPTLSDTAPAGCTAPTMNRDAAIDAMQTGVGFELTPDVPQNVGTLWSDLTFLASVSNTSSSSPSFTIPTDSFVSATQSPPPSQAAYPPNDQILSNWQSRFNQEWAMLSAEQDQASRGAPLLTDTFHFDTPSELSALSSLPLDTIRRLTELHLELFTLASRVPKPPTCVSQPLSWKDKDVALDRTFHLSHAFIEAVDQLASGPIRMSADCVSDFTDTPPDTDDSPLDYASLLLVLSCYQRLIEIYDAVFGNMQACLDRSSITAREDYVRMPDVKVGSFSLPDSSALQITLILQLARHLLRRMGSMVVGLNQKNSKSNATTNDLISVTVQTVCSRENELIERITKLRNTLVSLDIL